MLFSRSTHTTTPAAHTTWQPDQPLITLRHLSKVFKTPAGEFPALKEINLEVRAGEFVAVIGKSGSGKSTLINTITGIDRPTAGEVIVAGTPIHTLSENDMALWRGRHLGVIFQFFQLLPTLTLLENVMLPMEFAGRYPARERKDRALHLLDLVELVDQAHKLPASVSGGQQQRVAIARALANDPLILVADEPTGSLDSKTADTIFQLFEDLADQGKTILMVTHDQDLASRVSRVILIADGEVIDEYLSRSLQLVDQEQLVKISTRLETVTFAAGETIFRQGEPADKFYILINGEVDVFINKGDGSELHAARLGKGQYFGEIGLLQESARHATVRVTDAGKALLVSLDRETFRTLVHENRLTQDSIAHLMRRRIMGKHILNALPDLTREQLEHIESHGHIQHFVPGAIIFEAGETSDDFFLVLKGAVEVIQHGDRKQVVARLGPGQYFGELGLHKGAMHTVTVRAAPDAARNVQVVSIDREALAELVKVSDMTEMELGRMLRQQFMERES